MPLKHTPVVLLHGAGGSQHHWGGVAAHLRRDVTREVTPIELPGHGDAPGVVPETLSQALESIDAAIPGARPVSLVGHSLGGLLAIAWALSRPGRVARLGLVATSPRMTLHPDFVARIRDASFTRGDVRAMFGGDDVPATAVDLVFDDFKRLRFGTTSLFDVGRPLDVRGRLERLDVPTLVIGPAKDVVTSPRHGRAIAAAVPHAALCTIAGAGHYVHLERPAEVAQVLTPFLTGAQNG